MQLIAIKVQILQHSLSVLTDIIVYEGIVTERDHCDIIRLKPKHITLKKSQGFG